MTVYGLRGPQRLRPPRWYWNVPRLVPARRPEISTFVAPVNYNETGRLIDIVSAVTQPVDKWANKELALATAIVSLVTLTEQVDRKELALTVAVVSAPTVAINPTAPLALAGTPGDTQVSLTWSAPADDGGSAITDYIVQYRISP